MVKLNTTLVNATDKILVVYEVTSNGGQARLKELKPSPENVSNFVTSQTGETKVIDNPDFLVQSAVDPNDSYKTLRVWHGKEAVLGVSTDEMIDNMQIIIKHEDGHFTKTHIPRSSRMGQVKKKVKEVLKIDTSQKPSSTGGQQGNNPSSSMEEPPQRNYSSWIFKLFSKNKKT